MTPTNERKRTSKDLDAAYDMMKSDPDAFIAQVAKEDPVVFAEANLTNEKGDPISFDQEHGFQVDYLKDFTKDLVVKKSSQVGVTTVSATKILFLGHLQERDDWYRLTGHRINGITMIYTFPTANDVEAFSATRFKEMVNNSQEMVRLLGGKRGIDAVGQKRMGHNTIFFRGSTKATQAISIPADLIVNDELDFSAPNILEVLNSRISKSPLKWWWKFSTPTIPNYGIDAEYKTSNQMRFVIKCVFCNKRQRVQYPDNVFRKKIRGHRLAYWGCIRCHKELRRDQGVWVARYPNRPKHGYWITPGICPWIQPLDIANMRKNYLTEKNFRNFALGEAWSSGIDVITRDLLLSRIEYGQPYTVGGDGQMFMGVDQGDLLHYVVSRGIGGRREVIDIGTRTSFNDIGVLMNKYQISRCVLDALPNKKPAEQFAADFYGRVFLSIYKKFDDTGDIRESKTLDHGLNSDRTNTLDASAESWRSGESVIVLNKFQYSRIPPEWDSPSGKTAFIQQMGNMTRDEVEDKTTQKSRGEWLRTGPDHYRHADNYCYIAWLQGQGGDMSDLQVRPNEIMTSDPFQLERMMAGVGAGSGQFSDFDSRF